MKNIIIAVSGTGEVHQYSDPAIDVGMIGEITKRIEKFQPVDTFETYTLPYPADYGQNFSYSMSCMMGIKNLTDYLLDHAREYDNFFIIGYSQGAEVVTHALKGLRKIVMDEMEGRFAAEYVLTYKIAGVYLLSNPVRQPGHIDGYDPGGEGINWGPHVGYWGELKGKVHEYCAQGDIIASTDPDTTLLKRLGVYTREFNVREPIKWAEDARSSLLTLNPFSLYPELRKELGWIKYLSRWGKSVNQLANYIITNVHVKYATHRINGDDSPLLFDVIASGIRETGTQQAESATE